ncbi:MAG TPA: hypothetical protein PKE63_08395 [Lacibacter sp.]|nr:hypothetical protein [Lacibacter sp.]HMO88388.1 hypothetical protein [Lacibacter sp.]HMP87284.1 hypothetical protein [Lacibacter sp.]
MKHTPNLNSRIAVRLLLAGSIFLFSCNKESKTPAPPRTETQYVTRYFESQKQLLPSRKQQLEELESKLVLSNARWQNLGGAVYLLCPLSSSYQTVNNQQVPVRSFLLLEQQTQPQKAKAYVVQYHRNGAAVDNSNPVPVLEALYAGKHSPQEGNLTFLNLFDAYQFEYGFTKDNQLQYRQLQRKAAASTGRSGNPESVCMDWFLVTTIYYADGHKETFEEFLGTVCGNCIKTTATTEITADCDANSGNGGATSGAALAEAALNDLMPRGILRKTRDLSSDALRRERLYEWIFLESKTGTLRFISRERGVHVKNSANQWTWESLTHTGISREGIVIGGSVDVRLNSWNIVLGTFNAVVILDANVTWSVIYNGSPFSASRDFVCNLYLNVNDTKS